MRRSRAGVMGLGVALAAALSLAGCGGGGNSTSSSAGSGSARDVPAAQGAVGGSASSGSSGSSGAKGSGSSSGSTGDAALAASADPATLGDRRQVRTADLGLQVHDVLAGAARVRTLATAAKGFVQDERTSSDPSPSPDQPGSRPGLESVLTLRVPEPGLDRLMDQVAALGTQVSREQSSQDVTGAYVDVQSRLRTQRESVARVRVLLDRATTIGQVVQIESELTRRQADLESLERRLAVLDDQTTLATLTVTLAPVPAAAATKAATPGAFVAGLTGGWDALVASVGVALRIVGALFPFVVLAALVGVPVLLLMRRRRTQPTAG